MENEKTKLQLLEDEVLAKCLEIEALIEQKEGVRTKKPRVHGFIVPVDEDDFVVGYVREPSFLLKKRAMDKVPMTEGMTEAGELILDTCFLKDYSDPRILTDDDLRMTFIMQCFELVKVYANVIKKN